MIGINPCGCAVDMLRSCYTSPMNFFSDCVAPVTVRWFFCEPGALALPFATAFASSIWDNEFTWNSCIGENQQLYAHKYSNGHTPRSVNSRTPCGNAFHFAQGFPKNTFAPALNWPLPRTPATSLLWGSSLQPGVIVYDSQGIPLCCGFPNAPRAGALRWGNSPAAFGVLEFGGKPEIAGSLEFGVGTLPEGSLQLGVGTLPEGSLQLGVGTLPEGSLQLGVGVPLVGTWQLGYGQLPGGSLQFGVGIVGHGSLQFGGRFPPQGWLRFGFGILPAGSLLFGLYGAGSLMWGTSHGV